MIAQTLAGDHAPVIDSANNSKCCIRKGNQCHHTGVLTPIETHAVAASYWILSFADAELYDPASGIWTATGSLNAERYFHIATLLQKGNVLVAGGWDSNLIASASTEVYNQATGTWIATGSLDSARALHTATTLQNGKVLVAGRQDRNYSVLTSAELGSHRR